MATDKNLITKSSLQEIKIAEADLVDNLYQHANASLSKAHGWLLYNLPHPFLDAYGNDISEYQDSNGDRVGYYFLRLTYNGVNYFAPLETSVLPGKDAATSISAATNVALPYTGPQGTAWVTDFTQQNTQDILFTNTGVLLPHTRLGHWETHLGGIYQVIPQIITDSAGHRVSNFIARLLVDGMELWLPCDSRLGGPVQAPRGLVVVPASINWNFGEGEGYGGGTTCAASWVGSAPFTVVWQLLDSGGNWANLTNPDGSSTGTVRSADNRLTIQGQALHTAFGSTFTFTAVGTVEGGNSGTLRVLVSNSAGSLTASVFLYAEDETSCFAFVSGVQANLLRFSDLQAAVHFKLSQEAFGSKRYWGGYLVAGKRLKNSILARNRRGRFACWALKHTACGMNWKRKKAPFRLLSVLVFYAVGFTASIVYSLYKREADERMTQLSRWSFTKMYHKRLKQLRRAKTKE